VTASVTITDVARHAGVAVSTVSYVLSGKRSISATTRKRVLASIDVLGYHPHSNARAAAARRAQVIALVLPLRPGSHLPAQMRLVTAMVTAARQFDHDVLLMTSDDGPHRLRRISARSMIDGVLVLDVQLDDDRLPVLRELDRPSVLVGFPADIDGLTCVDLDFHHAARRCVEHLAQLGHRHVALLGPPSAVYERGTAYAHRSRAGFLATADELGLTAATAACAGTPDAVRQTLARLIDRRPGPTGLVVHNEAAVPHVAAELAGLGRQVPEDVSVVAICPDQVALGTEPPLSSLSIPVDDVGRQAVSLLIRKLVGASVPAATPIAGRITERASTATAGL
jgi:DNA-binding LacI/PurR family transcriptional regulator